MLMMNCSHLLACNTIVRLVGSDDCVDPVGMQFEMDQDLLHCVYCVDPVGMCDLKQEEGYVKLGTRSGHGGFWTFRMRQGLENPFCFIWQSVGFW